MPALLVAGAMLVSPSVERGREGMRDNCRQRETERLSKRMSNVFPWLNWQEKGPQAGWVSL